MKIRDLSSVASAGARVALRSYGDELRKARVAARLRQEDLAHDLGVSTQAIRLWEAGKVEPNEANKERLAVHFGEHVREFHIFYEDLYSRNDKKSLPVVSPELLRKARQDAGFTQAQAAERIGLSRFSIVRYESGASRPSDDTLGKLSELYAKRSDWFLVDGPGISITTEDRTGRVQDTVTPAARARIALEAAVSELPDDMINKITLHIGATRLFNRLAGNDAP